MDHFAGLVSLGRNVPQFLDTQAINLRLTVGIEREVSFQALRQMPARAFREERVLGVQFHARLIVRLARAVGGDTHVLRRHAHDCTALVEQHLRSRKTGENLHSQGLGPLREPAAEIAEGAGVIALVGHQRRHQCVRHRPLAIAGQHPMMVFGDRHLGQRAALTPVRQQFVEGTGVDHGARKDVRPDLRAFLEHDHLEPVVQLLQADRGGEARRAGADDHHVDGHRLPRRFFGAHRSVFARNEFMGGAC